MHLFKHGLLGTVADRHYMPGADTTQWDPLFKEDYTPSIVSQLNEENLVVDFMDSEFSEDSWQGREKVQPIKIGRNWSVGSIGAGGALPQAGRSAWENFRIPIRDCYVRVGFERYVIAQSRNKKGSWQQVIPTEIEGAVQDLAFTRNRIGWGYGSGILAVVNGALAAATTVVVDNPANVTGSINGNRFIFGDTTSGMFVHFLHPTTFAIEASATVATVNANGLSFTTDVAVTCTDNALIVLGQTATQNSYNMEAEGMLAGIDDGTYVATYHNLSRTTYPILNAYVTTGVGALSLDAIQQPIDATSIRVGKTIDMMMGEHAVRRSYLTLLETDRRYTGADLKSPDGGTRAAKKPTGRKAITYGDIPFFVDRDAPYGMLFGVTKDSWVRYYENQGEWDDTDGNVLKWVQGFDQFTAYFYLLENFHCQRPNCNWRMEGIDVDQLVVHSF